MDIVSKPARIRGIQRLQAFSLESQPAPKTTEGGKGSKLTYFSRTTCAGYHLDAQPPAFVGPHEGEVPRY